MWDSNSPMQLLKSMPAKLNYDNLQKIQMVIDADKYKNSIVSGFDLCGIYAPFCRGCNKMSIYPCAVAYVRMMQSEGMNIEIDAAPAVKPEATVQKAEPIEKIQEPVIETVSEPETEVISEIAETERLEIVEEAVEEVAASVYEQPIPEEQVKQENKIKIRIAVAKRKV